MILMMIMIMNIVFINSNSPLILTFTLLIQTMIMSVMVGKMNLTFWFSFIIFLIFVGGMLILFFYIISLINNKLLFHKINLMMMIIIMTIILKIMNLTMYNNNYETNLMNFYILNNEPSMYLIKSYNLPNLMINMMLVIYLFIMMIIISKITNFNMGPFYKKH